MIPGHSRLLRRRDLLIAGGSGQSVRFLSVPELREVRSIQLGGVSSQGWIAGGRLVTLTQRSRGDERPLIRLWPLSGGGPRTVGGRDWSGGLDLDAAGRRLAYGRGRMLCLRRLDVSPSLPERIVGHLRDAFADVTFVDGGNGLVTMDKSGEIRLWSLARGATARVLETTVGPILAADREGRRLAVGGPEASVDLWDLRDPPDAGPTALKRPDPYYSWETGVRLERFLAGDEQLLLRRLLAAWRPLGADAPRPAGAELRAVVLPRQPLAGFLPARRPAPAFGPSIPPTVSCARLQWPSRASLSLSAP